MENIEDDRETLYNIARTSLRTKLEEEVFVFEMCDIAC